MTLSDFLALPGAVEHDGGPCPVDGDMVARVLFADGDEDEIYASFWSAPDVGMDDQWTWDCAPEDRIIAYIPENTNG